MRIHINALLRRLHPDVQAAVTAAVSVGKEHDWRYEQARRAQLQAHDAEADAEARREATRALLSLFQRDPVFEGLLWPRGQESTWVPWE